MTPDDTDPETAPLQPHELHLVDELLAAVPLPAPWTRAEFLAAREFLANMIASPEEKARVRVALAAQLQAQHDARGSWSAAARALDLSGFYVLTLRQLAGLPCETRVGP